jgi:hypothetical protein
VRSDDWAEPSLAARRDASKLGIAIEAIMPMIATTSNSSINENPLAFVFMFVNPSGEDALSEHKESGMKRLAPHPAQS